MCVHVSLGKWAGPGLIEDRAVGGAGRPWVGPDIRCGAERHGLNLRAGAGLQDVLGAGRPRSRRSSSECRVSWALLLGSAQNTPGGGDCRARNTLCTLELTETGTEHQMRSREVRSVLTR